MRLLLLLLLLFVGNVTFAQKELQMDSSTIESRSFNSDALEKLKNEREFQYENYKRPPLNLWDRFWNWFWGKINEILSTKSGRRTVNTVFAVLAVLIIGFFVWRVMGMNKEYLFSRNGGEGLDYSISTDDINRISFDEAIQEAVAAGNYRLAIRLLYLQSLKMLSDKGFIQWQINKTNSDYLKEVSGNNWSSLFSTLTYNFDYIWYGEAQVDKERYNEVQQQFLAFNNQL